MTSSIHLGHESVGAEACIRPEAGQFSGVARNVFGVENGDSEDEERVNRRRVEEERGDTEDDELDRSGVFDDEDNGDAKASGDIGGGKERVGYRAVVETEDEGRSVRCPAAPYIPTAL